MLEYSPARRAAYYVLLFVLLLGLVPQSGHPGDEGCWWFWATYMYEHGLGNVYEDPGNNYNPFFQYILWVFGRMAGSPERIKDYVHFIKAFTLVFDFAGAIWAASLVAERSRRFELSLLLLFNIGYLYDTLVWNQVDAIYAFWSFGAVVLAARQKAVLSAIFYALALGTKTQAIIFLPPLLLLWGPLWWQQPRRLFLSVGAAALTLLVLLVPFMWFGNQNYLSHIIDFNIEAAEHYPMVSMNSYNFWHIVSGHLDLMNTPDSEDFGGLTYKLWGLLLFGAFSAVVLMPLLIQAVRNVLALRRQDGAAISSPMSLVLLSIGLIPLVFTFFNTEMHERYWHPSILFLGAYGFLTRRYWPYILASVAYFLNLEGVFHFLQLKNYRVLLFQPWFVASLFALALALAVWQLYARVLRRQPVLADAPLVEVA